jgi:hypothetical protein
LSGTTGLSFSFSDANGTGAGTGTADATMTFRGTVSDINAALAGLTFAPTTSYTGSASVQIITNDLGNTAYGTAQSATDTVSVAVQTPIWQDNFTEATTTALDSHTSNVGSGGYTNYGGSGSNGTITGGTPGWYAGHMGEGIFSFDPGAALTSASFTFVWQSSFISISFWWNGRGVVTIGSGTLGLYVGSHSDAPSVTLTAGTTYTLALTDDGTNVAATVNSVTASVSDSAAPTGTTCTVQMTNGAPDSTALMTNMTVY